MEVNRGSIDFSSYLRRLELQTQMPIICGHRGAGDQAPENTREAAKIAINNGCRCVECDIRTTSDGEFILMHDASVNRTTSGTGNVVDLTLAAIQALDAGSWFYAPEFAGIQVPSLDQFLTTIQNRVDYLIMHLYTVGNYSNLVTLVKNHNMVDKTIFISFDTAQLTAVRGVLSTAKIAPLTDGSDWAAKLAYAQANNAWGIDVEVGWTMGVPGAIKTAHDSGLMYGVWTIARDINEMANTLWCLNNGVDKLTMDNIAVVNYLNAGRV